MTTKKHKKETEKLKALLNNNNIEKSLTNKKNLPLVEYLLSEEIERLDRFDRSIEQEVYRKAPATYPEVYAIFKDVCNRIDDFLEIENMRHPNVRAHLENGYEPNNEIAFLKYDLTEFFLLPGMGHEYAHHVCKIKQYNLTSEDYFCEGFARGMEREISQQYRREKDDDRFAYGITQRTVGELRSAYLWLCESFGKEPLKSLIVLESEIDEIERFFRNNTRKPTEYAIGNTYFVIKEYMRGKDIYKKIIHR